MDKRSIHIALDIDKTVAMFDNGDILQIGDPILPMIHQVKLWVEKGHKISIFTARVSTNFKSGEVRGEGFIEQQRTLIWNFLSDNGLPLFPITANKDPNFTHFVDDKAVKVIPNMGIVITTDTDL